MKTLADIRESFIEKPQRSISLGRLPVSPLKQEAPIVPMDRWELKGDPQALVRKYSFRRIGDRARFINEIMAYEDDTNHNATIVIDHENVYIRLITKNIEQVTELDKEYAQYADSLFRDIVYSP